MEMECYGGGGGGGGDSLDTTTTTTARQRNRTSPPTPFHHLDASLFYSGASSHQSSVADAAFYTHDHYRVDSPDSATSSSSSSPVFSLSEITDGVDVDLLRAVFLLSDVVVLVYRLTATYITVRALRRRFTSCSSRRRQPPACCGAPPSTMVADGGSTLRSSSSRTALTSGPAAVPDTSNIYTDPQSLVVENCATLLRRPVSGVDPIASSRRQTTADVKYSSSGRQCLLFTS